MKRILSFCLWLLLAVLPGARAAAVDDQYVEIYGMLEEADKLGGSAQPRAAVTKYLEAQAGLRRLQTEQPDWNSKIVTYRLGYIAQKLDALTQKLAPAVPAAPQLTPGQLLAHQIQQLQEETTRLAAQNSLLEAKLKEALTVQPAAMDPRELSKAEERIKLLQKERDLLAVTLEQARAIAASSEPGPQKELGEVKQRLIQQSAVADVLQRQKEELQKQLRDVSNRVKKPGQTVEAFESTLAYKETIAMLAASNRVLQAETTGMEDRLVNWVRRYNVESVSKQKDYEQQLALKQKEHEQQLAAALKDRAELTRKLNEVTRELNKRLAEPPPAPAVSTVELEKQLEGIRAKLSIFEAKQVPFTAEELALFKQPNPKLARAETNTPPVAAARPPTPATVSTNAASTNATTVVKKKDPRELPPGAGPLIAEAQRAIDGERFADAEAKYQEVLRQDQDNVYVLANLGAVQMDQGKTAEAEKNLAHALKVDPEDSATLYMMGNLKLQEEKYDEAVELLSLSAKINPDKAQTQFFLGKALIQKGNRGPAESALRRAVQLKPSWGEPHYLLAVMYSTQQPNFPELAQYHYKKAIVGGAPRNLEFERWMERPASSAKP